MSTSLEFTIFTNIFARLSERTDICVSDMINK